MTIEDFVKLMWNSLAPATPREISGGKETFCGGDRTLLHYGHVAGWLEDQDEVHPQASLDKRTAARITHQFMKIELHIPDEPDISKAEVLKDLYTCRVCANHVAQIFVKGIMDCDEEIDPATGATVQLFNMLSPVSTTEAGLIIEKIKNLK